MTRPRIENSYNIQLKRVVNRRLVMGVADCTIWADGELAYTITDMKVGLQAPEKAA